MICWISGILTNTVFQQEVSQLCIGQIGQSECNGVISRSIHASMDRYYHFAGDCDSWTLYSSCCEMQVLMSSTSAVTTGISAK